MIRDFCAQLSCDCKIVTVTNFDEIEAIRSVWERMQREEPYPVPNADIDRYLCVIKTSGDDVQPHIMVIERDGLPAAVTIGRIEKRRLDLKLGYKTLFSPTLRCLSIVYGGIIGKPPTEICKVLIDELMNMLRRRQVDLVFFNHLGIDSPVYNLCKTMPCFFSRTHFVSAEPHWQTSIPDSVEEFYNNIPNSRKRRWRRDVRQLEKISSSEIKIVCYHELHDVDYLIDVACRINESTYKSGLAVGFTDSSVNRALLEQSARDGRLRAYILYVGDEPCAFQFDVLYGKAQFTEFGSFDPRWSRGSPGTVLLIKVLEQICQDSEVSIMDYGFGHALYKSKFGTNHWMEENVCIYATRLRPVLINMAMSADLAFCRLLNRAAKSLNMDSWVKRNWRRMIRKGGNKQSIQEKGDIELQS